ncbi:protein-export chaperone SecB, partial [Escherichia coli]|nr:protein-export chaperone SecB [Escherichia coli]
MRRNDLAARKAMGRRHAYLSGNHSIMSDENNQPFFNIQRIYLKDMSLEQPNSPGIFLEQEMPSVEVEVDVKAERLADTVFDILV